MQQDQLPVSFEKYPGEKTMYIIRHGETELNKQGIVQGRGINASLNETGFRQAGEFFRMYHDVPFDRIYTSTLLRTHQTVQQFIDTGLPWEQLPGLDELAWGEYEGRESTEETRAAFRTMMKNWTDGQLDFKPKGGESPLEVQQRQIKALDHILGASGETILICMHGRALRLILSTMMQTPLREMDNYPHQNVVLYKVGFAQGRFSILEANNIKHLSKPLI